MVAFPKLKLPLHKEDGFGLFPKQWKICLSLAPKYANLHNQTRNADL